MAKSLSKNLRNSTILLGLVGIVACGTASERRSAPERVLSTTEAVTGAVTYPINVSLPTGTSIVDTTVGASGPIWFTAGDQVLGPTASAHGTVDVEALATSNGITSGGNVSVDLGGTVNGNVVAGGLIVPLGKVTGSETPLSGSTKPFTTSWSVTNPGNSQGAILLTNNAIASPTPATYDAVVVSPGSSIYLRGGTYFFQSLDLEPGANLYVDSSHGPVFVYVTSTLIFRGNESSLDASIPELFMAFLGSCEVDLEAPFNGVFLAPNAPLLHLEDALWVLNQSKQAAGNNATFYSNSILVDPGEIIKPTVFDWSSVPGMPLPPGGWAANGGASGTGVPGSGGTSGGAGSGGATTMTGTIPLPAVAFHLSNQTAQNGSAPSDSDPGFAQTTTSSVSPSSQVPFHLPPTFDVGGVLANGTVTLNYTSCAGTAVTCTYQGGSSSASPTTLEDLEAGRTATFVSCSDGQAANAARCGTAFTLTTQPAPGWPVSVDLALDDRACTAKADLLTPLQTRQMLDSFSWPDPTLANAPTVAATGPDGKTPALYYGWVYVQNATDVLRLRKMYMHMLSRPFYRSDFEPYAGQCVQFQNPGDGVGTFVPVIIPGKVYNTLVNVLNKNFQGTNKLQPGDPLFKAVILKSTTPIDFNTLKNSGFRFLDYEGGAFAQSAMRLQGSALSEALQTLETFALQAVQDVYQAVTSALGSLDALFASRVNYELTLTVGNSGTKFAPVPGFTSPPAIRAWGALAGTPLGAGGLQVTFFDNLLGLLPETFSGHTDDLGSVTIRPAKHSASDMAGWGYCVELNNDAAWATSFLLPNQVCNLQAFDKLGTLPDTSQDRKLSHQLNSPWLAAMYGMTDAFKYMKDVAGYTGKQAAHALVGDAANIIGSFDKGRPFTAGLHLRNHTDSELTNLLTPYVNNLGYAGLQDVLTVGLGLVAGIVTGGVVDIGVEWVVSTFGNNDIFLPDSGIDGSNGKGNREVASHEYGHYILLEAMSDVNPSAIDDVVGDTVISLRGNDNNFSTRYVNEAFADFISGQVTGIANYGWLGSQEGDNGKVCINKPCFDQNFDSPPSTTNTNDKAGIARIASLLHDAFDGQPGESIRTNNQPDNADPWTQGVTPYQFTSTPWGDADGPDPVNGLVPACRAGTGPQVVTSFVDAGAPSACVASESVAMPGARILDFAGNLTNVSSGSPYFTDQGVFTALDQTMIAAGFNWCQRCQVLALHSKSDSPAGASPDTLGPIQLLKLCARGDGPDDEFGQLHSDEDPDLFSWNLPAVPAGSAAPDRDIRLDASTCQTCPPDKSPDANGRCTVDCPADFTFSVGMNGLGTFTMETVASGIARGSDPCPGLLVVEVDSPNQYFNDGATSLSGSVSVDLPSTQACAQSFTLSFADLPTSSTTGFVVENTSTVTGSFTGQGGVDPTCNAPSDTLSQSSLTFGASPIRFVTPVQQGVSFTFSAPPPPPPTR